MDFFFGDFPGSTSSAALASLVLRVCGGCELSLDAGGGMGVAFAQARVGAHTSQATYMRPEVAKQSGGCELACQSGTIHITHDPGSCTHHDPIRQNTISNPCKTT